MDWLALSGLYPRDKDLPLRAATLDAFSRVLEGVQYDVLSYPFSQEMSGGDEYVPLAERRPSVTSGLCRSVVDDSVSLTFGEGHFPGVMVDDADGTGSAITNLIRETSLAETMIDATTRGSVGSIAILFQAIENRPAFMVMPTMNLTPVWQKARPRLLESVTERYKVKGADLADQGHVIASDDLSTMFWFQRVWDDQDEIWFLPQTVADASERKPLSIDIARSVEHGLGFVPLVWIKNLPGGDAIDGVCTFKAALNTTIEIDYLLSQAGRGLKYASDPKLILKGLQPGSVSASVGGAGRAIRLEPDGDAKLLEINGSAATAVMEQVRYLRSLALESIHGNRSDADRVTAAQSGSAIMLMHQALLWLAGRLRLSYGENGLLTLLRMVCDASNKIEGGLTIGETAGVRLNSAGLELRWPAYFAPTNNDLLQTAQALVTAVDGGVLSTETAVQRLSALMDVDDAAEEFERVQAEAQQKAADALAAAQATATAASDVRAQANAGKTETRQITA